MRGQVSPRPGANYYNQVYQQVEKKDVPLAVVIIAGVFIWVLIFGSVLAYAVLLPCGFTQAIVGRDTFEKFKNPEARNPPCSPSKDPACVSWKLDNAHDCGCFLRFTVIGRTCADYGAT